MGWIFLKWCLLPVAPALTVLVTAGLLMSCSDGNIGSLGGSGKKKKVEQDETKDEVEDDGQGSEEPPPPEDDSGVVDDGGDTGGKVVKHIERSGAAFQVKDIALLRSSINSCMGADFLLVTADMLLPTDINAQPEPVSGNRFRFLLPNQYQTGDDIIEKEKGNMVDISTGNRTGITSDSLTDTYLRSLETVANVVAHNCSPEHENCKCGSKEEARALLVRCLPGLDPDTVEMDEAAEMLGVVCSEGTEGMRKAIASMLSSYAFASAR